MSRQKGGSSPQPPYGDDVASRFWRKVARTGPADCWEWVGGTRNAGGYGVFSVEGWTKQAHRVAFELTVGAIPPGMTIDHRCLFKACVNPTHMEVVTLAENGRRGNLEVRVYAPKSHCKRGHEFTAENTKRDAIGNQRCRKCHNAYQRVRYAAKGRQVAA